MNSNKLEINDLQYLEKYNGLEKTLIFKITNTTNYNSVISLESSISENTLSSVVLSKHILLNFHLDKKCNYLTMDEPEDTTGEEARRTAGWTAVPVAAEIITRIAPLLGLRPENNQDPLFKVLPAKMN